ncbi:NAD(P)-binding protein [Daldinia bambusicola]|nr:NAD(P)-binding protein [Daldinia bambusicola]
MVHGVVSGCLSYVGIYVSLSIRSPGDTTLVVQFVVLHYLTYLHHLFYLALFPNQQQLTANYLAPVYLISPTHIHNIMSSQSASVLLLGGTGKVGSRIAPLLHAAGVHFLVASRSGTAPNGYTGVKFDWEDESTWEPIFATLISTVYLVAPRGDAQDTIKKFVDLALSKGAQRFVLLSASVVDEGGPIFGKVHTYLRELGEAGKIGWAVLRPTWFQENFLQEPHLSSIKKENKIYSSTGSGKIPWISANDIAAVAFHALTAAQAPNTDYMVLGPELLTYADLAETFTSVLGRTITHVDITEPELVERWTRVGLPPQYGAALASMDTAVRHGSEDRTSDDVRRTTGKEPRRFGDFVEENKSAWARS